MKLPALCLAFACAAGSAAAQDHRAALQLYPKEELGSRLSHPALASAVTDQNRRTGGYDAGAIERSDLDWRAIVGSPHAGVVAQSNGNAAADVLRALVALSGGRITEAVANNETGLIVAAKSDDWQGDEARWQRTYPHGPAAVHLGDMEIDGSTQGNRAQVSTVTVDPASGAAVGAITMGIAAATLR